MAERLCRDTEAGRERKGRDRTEEGFLDAASSDVSVCQFSALLHASIRPEEDELRRGKKKSERGFPSIDELPLT